jgi:hypothetical protein
MPLPPDPYDDDLAESPVSSPPPVGAPTTTTAAGTADAGTADAGRADDRSPVGSSSRPAGRRSVGSLVAGIVGVVAIAGAIVLTSGGDDGSDAAPPADEVAADDAAGGTGDDTDAPIPGSDAGIAEGAPGKEDGTAAAGPEPTGDDDAASTPVAAAESFFAAVADGDCSGIVAHMTPESWGPEARTAADAVAECEADADGVAVAAAAEWEDVRLVEQDGDTATVAVTMVQGRRQTGRELPMRLVRGRWLMDLDTPIAGLDGMR